MPCVCICGELVDLEDTTQCFYCMNLKCFDCFSDDIEGEGVCDSCNRIKEGEQND